MNFLISVAWRNLWRHRRRSLITAGAMAIGIAMCMASLCFQDGMFNQIFDVMVEQRLGHIQLHHPNYPGTRVMHDTIPDASQVLDTLDGQPTTQTASPRLNGFGLIGGEQKSAGALLVGVFPDRTATAGRLDDRILEGRYLANEAAGEVVLGHKLFADLELKDKAAPFTGDYEVVVVTQAADGSLGNAIYTVVGTYKTGDDQMDRAGGYLHLTDLQDLLVLPDQIHQVTLLTHNPNTIASSTAALRQVIQSDALEVQAWWEADPQTANLMNLRDTSMFIVLGIVLGAAAFGVLNTMMMSVFERTRELGVLRALGIRAGRMIGLVVLESTFLAGVSCVLGLILGGALDYYLVTVGYDMSAASPDGFSFNGVMLDPVVYGAVYPSSIAVVVSAVFIISILASLWPAWRAASLRPVEAIRTE